MNRNRQGKKVLERAQTTYLPAFLLCVAGYAPSVLHAADEVVLASGNRLTGEIESLERGELMFDIDGADLVAIDWDNVVSLSSSERFDVELASGERLRGTIVLSTPTTLELDTAQGVRRIRAADIVALYPAGATFSDRLSGWIDIGLDFLGADDAVEWTLNAAAQHRSERYLTRASLTSLIRRSDSTTTQRRHDLAADVRRFFSDRWFAIAIGAAEHDLELGLDSRLLLGAGIGRALLRSNRAIVSLHGGLDVDREDFRGVDVEYEPEAYAAFEWDWFDVARDYDVLFNVITHIRLEGSSRTRVEMEAAVHRDLVHDFYIGLSAFHSYNSDPPDGFEKRDWAAALTLGRTF